MSPPRPLRQRERRIRAVPRDTRPWRSDVAVQAVMKGSQDLRVTGYPREATQTDWGHIVVRVGKVLLILEDRSALDSWLQAMARAQWLGDGAYGPSPRPPGPPLLAA